MNRTYKNTTIAILLACILTMAIGYSILSQRLNISGTSNISSVFDVQIINILEMYTEGSAETVNVDYDNTSASFVTNLQSPGDKAVYEIVVENKGNVNAYISEEDFTFNIVNNQYISLGIEMISSTPVDKETLTGYTEIGYYHKLEPGDKLYLYGGVTFKNTATSSPSTKDFNFTFNMNFHGEGYFDDDIYFGKTLYELMVSNEPLVTSGAGLYKVNQYDYNYGKNTTYYRYKSDENSNVNNYVSIDGKLWRIIELKDETYHYNITRYKLVEDELTINKTDYGFSTLADEDGYYNDLTSKSSIINSNRSYVDNFGYLFMNSYIEPDYNIFVNNNSLDYTIDFDAFYKLIPEPYDLILASSKSGCKSSTLATGGCKSWLTNNGDTYLYSKIYSDEDTNTGNIAYLEDGKVISVDPRNTNYGEYKVYVELASSCDFEVLNQDTADGSRNNPYIIDPDGFCDPSN